MAENPDEGLSVWDPNCRFEEEARKDQWGAGHVLGTGDQAAPADADRPPAPEAGVLPVRPLPPFRRWSEDNTIYRLGAVAFNFWRAMTRLAATTANRHDLAGELALTNVLLEHRIAVEHAVGGWVVTADGEAVFDYEAQSAAGGGGGGGWSDWLLQNRFRNDVDAAAAGRSSTDADSLTLRYAWSAFPRANNARKWRWRAAADRRREYVDKYTALAALTAQTMMATAHPSGAGPVACVFNAVGGGAFLRNCKYEVEIAQLLPLMLIVGWCRARARSPAPGHPTALLLVGMGDAHSVLAGARIANLASWLGPDRGYVESWLRGCRLPAGVHCLDGDMITAALDWKRANPGWECGVSMAADEASLGNMYLSLQQNRGGALRDYDPWNGARRASDENNTRRTTLMEVAIVFNADQRALCKYLSQPNFHARARANMEALQKSLLLLQEAQIQPADRQDVLAFLDEGRLTEFLDEIQAFKRDVARRGAVRDVIAVLESQ